MTKYRKTNKIVTEYIAFKRIFYEDIMDYKSAREAAQKQEISKRRVQKLGELGELLGRFVLTVLG